MGPTQTDAVPLVELTVADLLDAAVAEAGDREALVMRHPREPAEVVRWTYAALGERVEEFARALLALGVARGQAVAVVAPNAPAWVVAEFAVARAGAVLVPLNPTLRADELRHALGLADVSVCFVWPSRDRYDSSTQVARIRSAVPTLRHVVSLDRAAQDALGIETFLAGASGVSKETAHARAAETQSDDVAQIQFTSGTTGRPKGARLTHRSIVNNALRSARLWRADGDDRWCNPLPLFHTAGCVTVTLGAVAARATHVPLAGFDPRHVLDTIERERCTLLSSVPTILTAVLEGQRSDPVDTSSLRLVGTSGAPVPRALGSACQRELGAPLRVLYGATELSPTVSGTVPEDPGDLGWTTVGRPLPGTLVRVADPETGLARPVGVAGELQVSGYQVMLGYHGDDGATAEALTGDGWFRTGDLASMDETGRLRIVGRLKDVVIRGGENLYPAEIEDVLRGHPQILDVAVVGVPDPFFGEEACAVVIARPGQSVDGDELRAWMRGRTTHQKVPRYIHVTHQLPKTGSGKVQKFQLRQEMAERFTSEESQQ